VIAQLLRAGLLEGRSLLAAHAEGAGEGSVAFSVRDACAAVGAAASACALPLNAQADGEEQRIEAAVAAAVGERALDVLVLDGGALFTRAGLVGALQAVWNASRAVAQRSFIVGEGGQLILIAPPPSAGEHARAAAAGLENLARTLSIEWARYTVTAVAIAPGSDTTAGEVAALVAYLASPAGAYFSGCLIDLRGVGTLGEAPAPVPR
jgi:hypothetical protein